MNQRIERAQAVFNCLKENGFTFASFMALAISSIFFSEDICTIEDKMLHSAPSGDGEIIREWILKNCRNIYEAEICNLLKKETNLHMNASSMQMEQFEVAQVQTLKDTYKAKAPMLWGLLFHLLNANIRSHKTWAPNTPAKVSSIPDLSDSTGGGNPNPYDQNEALTLYEIVCKSSCFTNKPLLTTIRKEWLSCQFSFTAQMRSVMLYK